VPDVTSEASGPKDADPGGGGHEQSTRVGWFRYYFDDDRWEWSDEVAVMHGYTAGAVQPTTELVLGHKHPNDRQTIARTLEDIRRTRRAFSARHHIVDAVGLTHAVIVVGDLLVNDSLDVIGTHGFYVDVTPQDPSGQETITAALAEITESRAAIEQAKGMLMVIYGLTEELAFDLLRWRSQQTNTKVRALAEQLVTEFSALAGGENLPARTTYDRVLMTLHERV
jgi:ANTAR domain-containing protein